MLKHSVTHTFSTPVTSIWLASRMHHSMLVDAGALGAARVVVLYCSLVALRLPVIDRYG